MTATNESNLGLYLGWAYGEDNWNTGMDANMAILGAISQLYVKSRSTSVKPVSPTNGDRYYVPVGATGDWSVYEKYIAIYSAFHAAWLYVPAKAGMEFRVEDESNASFYYNGTALVTSTSLSGYLTAASTYTATGDVTFQAPPKFSGSHTVDTTELATVGDVDTKIAAVDYSTFVRTTGDQAVAGIKTFASSPVIPNAANANQPVAKGQMDTAIAAVTGANVGTGADVFKAKSGNDIQMRTLVAGSNVTITENANDITISAPVAAVDETAGYSWTGEHTWDISGGKSFIVSDDPTFTNPTKLLGIFDHVDAVYSSGIMSINVVSNTLGSSSAQAQISAGDDGSVVSILSIGNNNGSAYEGTSVEPDGSSSKSLTVGDYTVNIGGSFYVVDDATTPTKYFGIFDGVDLPATGVDLVYGHNLYVSGDNTFGNYWYYDKTDFSGAYVSVAKNANGQVIETASVLADGTSQKTITADTIKLTGVQQHNGYKSGTLASPPAGMVIGEVWADTTDSATHPIYRISTVAT